MAHRIRRMISSAFDLSFLSNEALYSRGALALDKNRSVLSPQGFFAPAISSRCGSAFSNIWGLLRRQHGSSRQNSEKVPSSVFLLRSNELCRSLRFDLLAAGFRPKCG